jgi:NhaP-type Na+/H+ or K+/H+ antiporter
MSIDFFIDFFWAALIGSVIGAALGIGVVLASQWRETDWDDEE